MRRTNTLQNWTPVPGVGLSALGQHGPYSIVGGGFEWIASPFQPGLAVFELSRSPRGAAPPRRRAQLHRDQEQTRSARHVTGRT